MELEDVAHPVVMAITSEFLTARAAARRMVGKAQESITAAPTPAANVGGFGAACAAIEGLRER
jgi:hypothetical protein